MATFQKILDGFYYTRKWIVDCLTYLSIRFYGIDNCTFSEVKQRSSDKARYCDLELHDNADLDMLLTISKDSHKTANDRRTLVTDKCKTLQALSAFLLTIIGIFLPKAFDFDSIWMKLPFYLAVLFLLNSVTMLLVYYAVGAEAVVVADQKQTRMAGSILKKWLINQYGRCTVAMDNRTDYLVNVYNTARFFSYLLSQLLSFFSVNYFTHACTTETEKIIQQLRSDPQLINLLRGPKGESGLQGMKGDHGSPGQKGDKGDNGEKSVIDPDDIVKHLISDPRFQKLIHDVNPPNNGQSKASDQKKP